MLWWLAVGMALIIDRVIVNWSLTLPLVVLFIFSGRRDEELVLPLFLWGMVADLVWGRTLGISTMFFLGLGFGAVVYRRIVPRPQWWSLLLMGFMASIVGRFVWGKGWSLLALFVEMGMVLVCWKVVLLTSRNQGEIYVA